MFAQTVVKQRIFYSEKIAVIFTLILMSPVIFSIANMPLNANDSNEVLKGYVQEKIMYEESNDNALFLLEKNWKNELSKKYKNNKIMHIEHGVAYIPIYTKIGSRAVKINVAEINRNINSNLEIIPKTADINIHSKSKISGIASKNNAIIAINGGYFKQDTGTTIGTLVIDNEIITGPIYARAGLGITNDGFKISRIKFKGEISANGSIVKIDNINQPRISASHVLIYTSKWGNKAPLTSKPTVYISVKNNKITAKSNKPLNIDKDNIVISAPKGTFKNFKTGDTVKLSYNLNPDWRNVKHIISGGPYLIKDNRIFIDTEAEKLQSISGKNPRTAVGYTLDKTMIMVTVDGRKEGNSGVTLQELAALMKELGCYEAINLDGGSSTSMYVNGKIYTGSNIKGSAAVNNVLLVRKKVS